MIADMPMVPRRWPLIPTISVLLASGLMVALGIWQVGRHHEKQAIIAAVRANADKPAISYPAMGPVSQDALFRPSSVFCLRIIGWTYRAGRAEDGSSGYRAIAHCSSGAEGPGALVEIGVAARADVKPRWNGGPVNGYITEEPDGRSIIARIFGPKQILRPMLVAARSPDPQFRNSARPDADSIPDNHIIYAVQWFLFALMAVVIYGVALGFRQRGNGREQGAEDS